MALDFSRDGVRPSHPFIFFLVERILHEHQDLKGDVKITETGPTFIPRSHLSRERDMKFDRLRSGDIPFVDLKSLIDDDGNRFAGPNDSEQPSFSLDKARHYLRDHLGDSVEFYTDFALSTAWLQSVLMANVNQLKLNGYITVSVSTIIGNEENYSRDINADDIAFINRTRWPFCQKT